MPNDWQSDNQTVLASEPTRAINFTETELTALIQLIKSHTTERSDARLLLMNFEKLRRELRAEKYPRVVGMTYRGYNIKSREEAAKVYDVNVGDRPKLISFSSVDGAITWIDNRIAVFGPDSDS